MPETIRGYPYPTEQSHTRMWEHLEGIASAVDADVQTVEDSIEDAWVSYTPVWSSSGTAPALGNGTITGKYKKLGTTYHVRIVLTLGSTSTVGTGVYSFSLPVGAALNTLIPGVFQDTSDSSRRYSLTTVVVLTSSTGSNMRMVIDGSTSAATNVMGASNPVVPANGDILTVCGTFEAA